MTPESAKPADHQLPRDHGAKTILMAHFWPAQGKAGSEIFARPIGEYLHSLIHHPVIFSHDRGGN